MNGNVCRTGEEMREVISVERKRKKKDMCLKELYECVRTRVFLILFSLVLEMAKSRFKYSYA